MEEKKYELLMDDTINYYGRTLYRIKALKDFNNVHKGDLGGYIEKESNLSHEGNCWVYHNAKVYDNAEVLEDAWVFANACVFEDAWVFDNAKVFGDAKVFEDAKVYGKALVYNNACVYGYAEVFGHAWVFDNAEVFGHARVFGRTEVSGNAKVSGDAWACDNAKVYGRSLINGNARISNNANISSNNDYVEIKGFGSQNRSTTFFKCEDDHIHVNCGCFNGTLGEFENKVKETHGDSKYGQEYMAAINLIKIHFNL